jgi:hypothetical protein
MTDPALNQLDRDIIESVLQMGGGYVLDFSDRTFAEFFADFGVRIDDNEYRVDGDSKARRLRVFIRSSSTPLVGSVLAALLERRLLKQPDGLKQQEVERYRALLERLGGAAPSTGSPRKKAALDAEAELLRRVFRPELLTRLPLDAALIKALRDRMEEAQACIEAKAFLAAVILCGSVLEGMCLGFGSRSPERVNRAYSAQYNRSPPQFYEWKLREWIDVLGRLGDLSPNVEKFGQALRDFRNYVHPAEQLAHRFLPDQHTARIGLQVVIAAIDDLTRACGAKEGAS